MRSFPQKFMAIGAAGVAVAVGAGLALAYWSTDGSGSAIAVTGTSSAVTVNQTSLLTPLFPGQAPQSLSGTFDNASAVTVRVQTVTASIESVTTAGGAAIPGCTAADYVLASPIMPDDQILISGSNVGAWSGATLQFNDTSANQDACKGAVVHLAYSVG